MPADILLKPFLALNRLVVFRAGQIAYDQIFHEGVNIIHGENGSGKSTIMDFIFHVLGGEAGTWKEYASLCDNVIAELTVNDACITLRREVSTERQRPLHVFFGDFEAARSHSAEGWQTFPYSRTTQRESLSQILFSALGLPEAQTADGNSVTMHQMLRLLYSDQMTPVQRIFRFEAFDPPILKQAIGDFLCGIGGFELFEKQTQLREAERQFTVLNSELRSISAVLGGLDTPLNLAGLQREIGQLEAERVQQYAELELLSRTEFGDTDSARERERERRKAFEDLSRVRSEIQVLETEIRTLEFEIEDSELFLKHIGQLLAAFDVSALTYHELGSVRFEYCPACFSPIEPNEIAHSCHLCKHPLSESERASRSLAVKLDLQIQARESQQLQEDRVRTLDSYTARLRRLRRDHQSKAMNYDGLSRAPISSRDAKIGAINQRIGYINSTLRNLNERIELANKFDSMSAEKARINEVISRLRDEIQAITNAQDRRKRQAYTRIAETTRDYLHRDTGVQEGFPDAKQVRFSFGDDIILVDDQSNFAASSLVVLKNSFHLAMLASALGDEKFLLPRFVMFDNIEDKGMRPERSWNFQDIICNVSAETKTRHQIIFTTSMLKPELLTSQYVVGPAYTKESRTLRFQ